MAMLLLYGVGMSGIPVGPGALPTGCQCDKQLKATGNCCCEKKLSTQCETKSGNSKAVRSCCAKKQVVAEQAAAEQKPACCKSAKKPSHPNEVSIGPCGCDVLAEMGLLLNLDPRLPSVLAGVASADEWNAAVCLGHDRFESRSLAPETPPPKQFSV
ncbi:hypothetical protein SAMN05421753_1036 [Planctomicrobium piriforme]|uniref:Uncharacterized protein n=2 Tax=Planctomicrobium piriforme TaxID=1576369 RepID=A0A1I3CYB3_9PLAN|nr:hypothetical protein SAMN05421753_1036 [Planctomicrobium piriforme]